jgi:hypothetical protein
MTSGTFHVTLFMNPFTRFLTQWSRNRPFNEFVGYWDRLEQLVVQVYREKITVAEAELEFQQVWPWLRQHYSRWEEGLRPYWRPARVGGQPTLTDPFRLLLAIEKPADILGDWRVMQHLPAAREALNRLMLSQSETS